MPRMGGIEATRKIRELGGASASVPIVALTAHAISGVESECRSAGMNGFVSKPIDRTVLLEVIKEVLGLETRGERRV